MSLSAVAVPVIDIVLASVGMLLYAARRLVSAALPGDTDTKGWVKRIGFVVVTGLGFVAYGLFCLTTLTHRRLEAP
ncbi:MAG: hypothetical protein JWM34_5189 [Ilumatobacteraceae bacterium]|nr:hypothetical protein [Ilumatobacteraceae bacterium]